MSDEDLELGALWRSAAHRATDAQLVACAIGALLVAIGYAVGVFVDARRTLALWPILLVFLFAGAFGLWGIADREISERARDPHRALSTLRWCAAALAGASAVVAALGVLRLTIGTWVS